MKSVKLEKEAEVHAEQLAKAIVKRMMECFPLSKNIKKRKINQRIDTALKVKLFVSNTD